MAVFVKDWYMNHILVEDKKIEAEKTEVRKYE